MSAQESKGIQMLKEAEIEAAKIVQKARQYRVQRLKDAKTEAAQELAALQEQKQDELNVIESSFTGSSDLEIAALRQQTDLAIDQTRKAIQENRQQVIDNLLHGVFNPVPVVHANLKTQ